ncbi:hypothetical protein HMSSN036_31130 [Paenibacillus macerans]|nr:hypothetical protein HMSSN036_31130 [Paenibacillus macerans]
MKGDANDTLNISFNLPEVPEYGVQFSFKVLDASNAIPQLAVFTNGMMSGLIQITGLNNGQVTLENTWKQTYKLYIPKEQLRPGENELQLKLDRGLYADAAAPGYDGDKYLWFVWDYFKMEALTAPAAEPLHGRYVHLGTTLMNRSFKYDENSLRHLAPLTKWMGVAYSGNWMRVAYWSDTVSEWKPQGRNYLLALRELNLQPMLGFWAGIGEPTQSGSRRDPCRTAGLLSELCRRIRGPLRIYGSEQRARGVQLAAANDIGHRPAAGRGTADERSALFENCGAGLGVLAVQRHSRRLGKRRRAAPAD